MSGFAAWTKNEGILFLAVVAMVRAFVVLCTGNWRSCLQEIGWFAAGSVPVLALNLYFKMQLAPPNFLSQGTESAIGKLTNIGRYLHVAKAFILESLVLGNALPLALAAYLFL